MPTKATTVRKNTRLFFHQDEFIKAEVKASKGKETEGEIIRKMIQFYIDKHKK